MKQRIYKSLNIKLKLSLKNKVVLLTTFKVIKRFHSLIRRDWDKAYVKVTYLPTVFNDGEYTNKKDLIKAFQDFTEKDLIDTTYTIKEW